MKRFTALAACIFMWAAILVHVPETAEAQVIHQVSTYAALQEGMYEGLVGFSELRKHGDFGLGTVTGLNGEMIALDGRFYRADVNGIPHAISDDAQTPFAVVTFFQADDTISLERSIDLKGLRESIDRALSDPRLVYAVRVTGVFSHITLRSVPGWEKPYPKLEEALKSQKVFERKNVSGTLVGFRYPDTVAGLHPPGYHFHFLSDDMTVAGHVLACAVGSAEAQIAAIPRLMLNLSDR